ncbi:MAG: DUF1501 domain-containing protein [Verrucomicrobiia bacterium]
MNEIESTLARMGRRQAIKTAVGGLGSMALGSLLAKEAIASTPYHHKAKARRVIYLFQSGGPSQLDLFDYKPALEKYHGRDLRTTTRFTRSSIPSIHLSSTARVVRGPANYCRI